MQPSTPETPSPEDGFSEKAWRQGQYRADWEHCQAIESDGLCAAWPIIPTWRTAQKFMDDLDQIIQQDTHTP